MRNKIIEWGRRGLLSLGLTGLLMSGCAQTSPHQRETSKLNHFETSPFNTLKDGKVYVVLIEGFQSVEELSQLAGFSGNYGHIEVIYNGKVLGCRPPTCSEISVSDLGRKFRGAGYQIREVPIEGDPERAVEWFREKLEGEDYDLFYSNCTDALVGMYAASGDDTRRIHPVRVRETYDSNPRLREYMRENGISLPNRETIFFPDQFEDLGELVGRGVF